MSLISSASPWINDDPSIAQRKRIATMKKPVPKSQDYHEPIPNNNTDIPPSMSSPFFANYPGNREDSRIDENGISTPPSRDSAFHEGTDMVNSNDRQSRVTDMVNKITSFPVDNTGNSLANFTPPILPDHARKIQEDSVGHRSGEYARDQGIRLEPPVVRKTEPSTPFAPNPNPTAKLSNYQQSYEPPMIRGYANSRGAIDTNHDAKVADRLSYIIHMLEEMKHETSNNVTEEFVLYSLLGIFVIYLVDAFARTGKYTR